MYVYKIINLINGNVYIGQSKRNSKKHRMYYYGSGTNIKKAIKLYGRKNFKKIIIVDNVDSIKQLNGLEAFHIWLHRFLLGKENVYNISNGK